MDVGAIILAGGKSTRMGTNKALLKINELSNIERIITSLQPSFPDPILVTNTPDVYRFLGVKMVSDHFFEKGPLAGIHAGLMASPYEVNVVVACDMPFVSANSAKALVNNSFDYDAVVPVIEGMLHPLFAVYKKKLAVIIEDAIKKDRLRIKDLLIGLNVLYLREQNLQVEGKLEQIFFNMNHPQEYKEALRLAMEEYPRGS